MRPLLDYVDNLSLVLVMEEYFAKDAMMQNYDP